MNFADKMIEIARGEIGCRENQGSSEGTNRSACVDVYHKYMQKKQTVSAFQWCAEFVYWVYGSTCDLFGIKNELFRSASTITMLNNSLKFRIDDKPARGAIFIYSRVGGGHAGIVEEVLDSVRFKTIEGNSGDQVRANLRSLDDGKKWRFIHVEDGKEGTYLNGVQNFGLPVLLIGVGSYLIYKTYQHDKKR